MGREGAKAIVLRITRPPDGKGFSLYSRRRRWKYRDISSSTEYIHGAFTIDDYKAYRARDIEGNIK